MEDVVEARQLHRAPDAGTDDELQRDPVLGEAGVCGDPSPGAQGRGGGAAATGTRCAGCGAGGGGVSAARQTPRLAVVPVTIGEARRFVEREHSHHHAPLGGLFAVAVAAGDRVVCVGVVSRPVARKLGGRGIAELTRTASDGTPHAASMCIAAATRAALALGYRRIISYTLAGEAGTSYRAAG